MFESLLCAGLAIYTSCLFVIRLLVLIIIVLYRFTNKSVNQELVVAECIKKIQQRIVFRHQP